MNFSDRVWNDYISHTLLLLESSLLQRMLRVPMSLGKGVSEDDPIKIDKQTLLFKFFSMRLTVLVNHCTVIYQTSTFTRDNLSNCSRSWDCGVFNKEIIEHLVRRL